MSTSGGNAGAVQLARAVFGGNQLAGIGNNPQTITVPNPGGRIIVPTACTLQFHHVDSTYAFTGDHLVLADGAAATLLNPALQAFTVDQVSTDPVTTSPRAPAGMEGTTLEVRTVGGNNPARTAPIQTVTIQAAGLGYAPGDTGTIDGNGSGGTYHVTTVGALGVVTGVNVTAAGANYDTGHNPHTTTPGGAHPGAGAGLTLNVTAVTAGASRLQVAVLYALVTPT